MPVSYTHLDVYKRQVYGRKRDIVNQRNHKAPKNTYTILRRKQHQEHSDTG